MTAMLRAMEPTTLTADISLPRRRARLGDAVGAIAAEIRRDGLLLGIVVGYALAVGAICEVLGKTQFYHPLIYMPVWMAGLVTGLGLYVFAFELPGAIRARPSAPLSELGARLRRHMTPRFVAGVLLFAASGLFTGVFTCMKSLMNDLVPFHADALLANLDASLHFGVDPWRLLQPLFGHHAITRLIQNAYLTGWLLLLLGFTGAAVFSSKLAHVRARFFFIYFIAWIVLGNVLGAAFMSGGPVYYGAITGDHVRFASQTAYLAFSDGLPNSSVTLQHVLWDLGALHKFNMGTGISAFPSLHVATVTLFTLMAFEVDKRLGWAVGAFAALILTGSVHLGWHYAIDGYFSAAVVCAMWFGAARLKAKPAA